MRTREGLCVGVAAIAVAMFLTGATAQLRAQQSAPPGVTVGESDLGGVVTGPNGPEAGVWVIAETTDLPTKFAKIVVTDDQGRYVLPELPKANYSVWVRGYGLVDSPKVTTAPGKNSQPHGGAGAQRGGGGANIIRRSIGTRCSRSRRRASFRAPGRAATALAAHLKSQAEWLNVVKTNGCYTCQRSATRPRAPSRRNSATFEARRRPGRAASSPARRSCRWRTPSRRLDVPHALKLFADWTDRIAAGELPGTKPPRPQGVERNVVITLWDWSRPKAYLHDEIATDKRKPTVNANGKIYGSTEDSTDFFPILDPKTHTATQVKMPVRDPKTPSSKDNPIAPSPYWGDEAIWDSQASMHNPMMDEKGQVWFTSRVGPAANPDFCKKGSEHPSAKLSRSTRPARHLSMYDPKTGKITLISTCFPTHHLVFAEDANNTLWTSAGGPVSGVVGWLNRKMFEETGDEQKSQGWTALILDTNGNGKRDEVCRARTSRSIRPRTSASRRRSTASRINPVDGSVWGSALGYPGLR